MKRFDDILLFRFGLKKRKSQAQTFCTKENFIFSSSNLVLFFVDNLIFEHSDTTLFRINRDDT